MTTSEHAGDCNDNIALTAAESSTDSKLPNLAFLDKDKNNLNYPRAFADGVAPAHVESSTSNGASTFEMPDENGNFSTLLELLRNKEDSAQAQSKADAAFPEWSTPYESDGRPIHPKPLNDKQLSSRLASRNDNAGFIFAMR